MTFCVDSKQITLMLIEFSGGANTKSTQKKKKKEDMDTYKIYSNIGQIFDAVNICSKGHKKCILFVVRFVSKCIL